MAPVPAEDISAAGPPSQSARAIEESIWQTNVGGSTVWLSSSDAVAASQPTVVKRTVRPTITNPYPTVTTVPLRDVYAATVIAREVGWERPIVKRQLRPADDDEAEPGGGAQAGYTTPRDPRTTVTPPARQSTSSEGETTASPTTTSREATTSDPPSPTSRPSRQDGDEDTSSSSPTESRPSRTRGGDSSETTGFRSTKMYGDDDDESSTASDRTTGDGFLPEATKAVGNYYNNCLGDGEQDCRSSMSTTAYICITGFGLVAIGVFGYWIWSCTQSRKRKEGPPPEKWG